MNKSIMYVYEDGEFVEEVEEFDIDDKKEVEYVLSCYFDIEDEVERNDSENGEIMFSVSETEYMINKMVE